MKLETWKAVDLVRRGATVQDAADETGCPLSTLYAAVRKHCPRPAREKPKRATPEDIARWVAERVEAGFSYRMDAADAYLDFCGFIGKGRYLSAIALNLYLAEHVKCHKVRAGGRRWLVGARIR